MRRALGRRSDSVRSAAWKRPTLEAAEIEASGATDGGAAKYIVFEGAEGCGKSTQAARLATTLDAVLTRETGGTDIGARLRAILHDTTNAHLDDRAEALLAAADRAQHLAEVVRPALDAGRIVVSDRSVYSSLAYQGYGRRLDVADITKLNEWATAGCWPDLVIFLDTPDDVIAERMCESATSTASRRRARCSTSVCSTGTGRWRPPTPTGGSRSRRSVRSTAWPARSASPSPPTV